MWNPSSSKSSEVNGNDPILEDVGEPVFLDPALFDRIRQFELFSISPIDCFVRLSDELFGLVLRLTFREEGVHEVIVNLDEEIFFRMKELSENRCVGTDDRSDLDTSSIVLCGTFGLFHDFL